MGGFDVSYNGMTWFFDRPLDAAAIKKTLADLVTKLPALAGRRCGGGIVLNNKGARFSSCSEHAGSARDWTGDVEPPRGAFADLPTSTRPLFARAQPLFTIRVTNFADGTSAIGIAAPHVLLDGQSYTAVVRAFASAHADGTPLPSIDFDAASVWERATAALPVAAQPTSWLPARLLDGLMAPFWEHLIQPRVDSLMPRSKLRLRREELDALKAAVLAASAHPGTISTNEVLSAALFFAAAQQPKSPFPPKQPVVVAMVVNLKGKGVFQGVGEGVVGNFSHVAEQRSAKPAAEMSLGECAALFQELGSMWRDADTAAQCVAEAAYFYRVPDLTGWWWAGGVGDMPAFFMNNQSKLVLSDLNFGAGGALLGLHPWHSHMHVHVVAAAADAVDVYVPKALLPLDAAELKRLLVTAK